MNSADNERQAVRVVTSQVPHSELLHKKIVILVGGFLRGGCERQAYLLACHLRQHHGLDVQVWALQWDGDFRTEFEAVGIPTRVLAFKAPQCPCEFCGVGGGRIVRGARWARRLLRVVHQLREANVDILLPLTTWPNVVAGLTYKLARVRLCIWGERSSGTERVPTFERIAVRQYRRFAANSTAGVEFLVREMNVPRDRVSFVPNGVEILQPSASTEWRDRLWLRPGQPLVIKIANISGLKDHATVLRAWSKVQQSWEGPEKPVLALAGALGNAYDSCRKIVRESGLDSTVRFLGSISDVASLIDACDMSLFSSPHEGMPNGVLECMAGGKAVIASDLPGVRDALGPDAADVLIPPGNADQFAEKTLALLRGRERREFLGKRNRQRIETEFSIERMAERYLQMIRQNVSPPLAASISSESIAQTAISSHF